eukprot:m.151112 g.151112  ORF g.151112 m.151112 type:complete len:74 (+) comp11693_c0_seq13:1740-1961(+)
MMDPSAGLSAIVGTYGPARDGSSSVRMAHAIRTFLAADFDAAVSTHTYTPMDAASFRQAIDGAWRWLDGKPLA